jgi:hypothetical protein
MGKYGTEEKTKKKHVEGKNENETPKKKKENVTIMISNYQTLPNLLKKIKIIGAASIFNQIKLHT